MPLQHCAVTDGRLQIAWEETSAELDGYLLRSHCRCADCRARTLRGEPTATPGDVRVLAASPLGYGLQLHFSDGHNRGVYPWSYLRELADRSIEP